MGNDKKSKDEDAIKQKIRERYKGVNEELIDVIPAKPKEDFYKSEVHKRVAVYARVSTDDPHQTSSYELQKNHYEDMVNEKPNWDLVDIYADEGISGTSLQHRDNFIRMINHCNEGKIDIIVTKSVSRFARNIVDCISYVRQLKTLDPPVGVFFETENIFTLDENSEMALSFIATLAQEESHTKSEIGNASIEARFKRGIFLTPVLLGYDHDDEGNLIVNEEEAKTVRLIFFSYLYGYTTQQIADALTQLERLTKKGNSTWSSSRIQQILTNERYCGDVLARKTYTPNYLDHKSKKNRHNRNQYRRKNHHEAIISREDFFAVQKLLRNAKYGNKGYFPEMRVIVAGILKGFVSIHPRWAGFGEEDYYMASDSVDGDMYKVPAKPLEIGVEKGNFDLRGYELVRTQFMSVTGQPTLTMTSTHMTFNKSAIEKMDRTNRIEIFVHPGKKILGVRKAVAQSKNYFVWSGQREGELVKKTISGASFLPVLFTIFGWRKDASYKILGHLHRKDGESVLIFNANEAVLYVDENAINDDDEIESETDENIDGDAQPKKKGKKIPAYPTKWVNSFGDDYYKSTALFDEVEPEDQDWEVDKDGELFKATGTNVTSQQEAARNITKILGDIGVGNE
ncbi:recombinase family protein [Butyrivibrio sp. WCD3002]|uniref:recombinase family protein n=1 Tax=Butyrivibrio sp. WCD3002 TaxID=1280676 RepID=UPI000425D690|nr:recombinase family protein [Butyrivibrio sp. WCD3002]